MNCASAWLSSAIFIAWNPHLVSEVARLLAHEPQQRLSAQEGPWPGRWRAGLGPGRDGGFQCQKHGYSIGFTKNTWWKRLFRHLFHHSGDRFLDITIRFWFCFFWVCVKMGYIHQNGILIQKQHDTPVTSGTSYFQTNPCLVFPRTKSNQEFGNDTSG